MRHLAPPGYRTTSCPPSSRGGGITFVVHESLCPHLTATAHFPFQHSSFQLAHFSANLRQLQLENFNKKSETRMILPSTGQENNNSSQSASQQASQLASQSVSQPVSQPASQPANQPVSQSVSQPASQSPSHSLSVTLSIRLCLPVCVCLCLSMSLSPLFKTGYIDDSDTVHITLTTSQKCRTVEVSNALKKRLNSLRGRADNKVNCSGYKFNHCLQLKRDRNNERSSQTAELHQECV